MKNKMVYFLFVLTLLYGCDSDNTLHFKKDLVLDYGSNNSPLTLISKIGKDEVTKKMIDGNTLILKNIKLTCTEIDTNVEGIYNVEIETSDPKNPLYKIQVTVKDISPPSIKLKGLNSKGEIEIKKSQLSSLDLSSYVDIQDNCDKSPTTQIKTDKTITSAGSYTITITSSDINKNKASVETTLNIIDDTIKEEPEKKENNNTNKPSSNTQKKPEQQKPSTDKPQTEAPAIQIKTKQFLFGNTYSVNGKEYYCDWDSVTMICSSYISQSGKSGNCYPITSNGVTTGMEAKIK